MIMTHGQEQSLYIKHQSIYVFWEFEVVLFILYYPLHITVQHGRKRKI